MRRVVSKSGAVFTFKSAAAADRFLASEQKRNPKTPSKEPNESASKELSKDAGAPDASKQL